MSILDTSKIPAQYNTATFVLLVAVDPCAALFVGPMGTFAVSQKIQVQRSNQTAIKGLVKLGSPC